MSENESQLGRIPGRGGAAKRFADALLRSLGPTQITLRISNASSGNTNSQIGLEPPPMEEVQISPVLVRTLPPAEDGRRRFEVVVSALALKPIAKNYQIEDLSAWLLAAQGVLYCDQLLHLQGVATDHYLGADCLYRLSVTE